jgi:hypothetical protein
MDKAIIKEQLQVVLEETAHKIKVIEDRGRMTPFIRSTKQGLQLRYEALKRLANSVTWGPTINDRGSQLQLERMQQELPAQKQDSRPRYYEEQPVGAFEPRSRPARKQVRAASRSL